MVATQLLISLCLAGLAASAPQFNSLNNNNQEAIVEEVVVALGPSISEAVAAALAGLNFNSGGTTSRQVTTPTTTGGFGGSAGFGGSSSFGASAGGAVSSGFGSSTATRQSSTGFAA